MISDQNDNRFMIREEVTSDDGKTYENVVFLDSDVLKNTNRHHRNIVFTDYVRNNFAGVSIPVYNENGELEIISFAKKNERVLKDGARNDRKVLDKLATKRRPVEMSVVLNSEEVLQTSRDNGGSDDHSHQWLDQNGWKFRKAYVQMSDGSMYSVNLNIAQARDGRNIFYDVNDIKKIGVGNLPDTSQNNIGTDIGQSSGPATTTDYDGSVSQPAENVNTSDMKFMARENNLDAGSGEEYNVNININTRRGEVNGPDSEAAAAFRELQEEARGMSREELELYHREGIQENRGLRDKLAGVLGRELETRAERNNYRKSLLTDRKENVSREYYTNLDGETFHDVLEIVQSYLENGDAVDVHDAADYYDCENYLSTTGLSGFSITKDGDLVSVFSMEDGLLGIISDTVKREAKTLDCYQSEKQPLADYYNKKFGFKVASLLDFNYDILAENRGTEYADFFVNTYGEAPVAFMVNTDADVETRRFGKDDYDAAKEYQLSFVENDNGPRYMARESDYYLPEDEEETLYNGEKDFRLTGRYREALTGMGYDRTDDQIVRMDPEGEAGENRGNVPAYNKYPPRDEYTRKAMDRISKTSRPNPRDMEKVASSFDQADNPEGSIAAAVGHDTWHYITDAIRRGGDENANQYIKDRTARLLETLDSLPGYDLEARRNQLRELNEKLGKNLTESELDEELVGNGMWDLITNDEAVRSLAESDAKNGTNFIQWIREALGTVIEKIRNTAARCGVAEARALVNAEEALARFNEVGNEAIRLADQARQSSTAHRAVNDQGSGISDQSDNRFMIREEVTSDDGKTYENVVFLDSDVLKNTNRHNRNKVFTDYVRNNFAGVSIPVYNENGEQEIVTFAEKK